MALLDRLAVRAISSLAHLFRRPLVALFGRALLWLVLAQVIKRTIDPHPSARFTTAFNIAGLIVIGSAVLYAGLIAPVVSATKLGAAITFRSSAGPVIGRDRGELLRFPGEGHLLTIAAAVCASPQQPPPQ